ncbi:OPT oligopeptide transporter protein, partial [Haemophilus influenzae]
AKKSD